MALLFLGKLLIAVGICFQAYTLYEDKTAALAFDTRLATHFKSCNWFPAETTALILQNLRLVVVGLLASSALMVLFKTAFFKFTVFLGLALTFYIRHWPITAIPSFKDHAFWEQLAIIGGIIYLMGAESSCSDKKSKSEKVSTKT